MGTTTVTREVWTVQWLTPQQPGFNMTGVIFGVKMTGSQHWGLSISRKLENQINIGPISVWDVKEPLSTTGTLAVTTLSASIERSAWRKSVLKKTD